MINLETVKAKVFTVLEAAWTTPTVTPVEWPRAALDSKELAEWIRPDVLNLAAAPQRRGQDEGDMELQVHIFTRTELLTNTYRPEELAALLGAVFDQADFETGAPIDYGLRFSEAQTRSLPEVNGVSSLLFTCPFRVEA